MKISASFLACKNIFNAVKKISLTDVDYIHVDVVDNNFVKGRKIPLHKLTKIYKYTSKRLDVHLMVEDPSKYIPLYAELNTEFITFHVEVDQDIEECLKLIHSYSIKAGLAIKPNTKVSELVPYLPFIDLVLVMSVEPGKGGQEFIKESSSKIEEVRALLDAYNSNAVINVDGGVNDKSRELCSKCDIVTAGSYIVRSDDFQEKVTSLR